MTTQQNQILVVDDEPKLVRLVREILTAKGYKVFSSGSGNGALEIIATENIDLILLDIVLSDDVDGYQVARQVREFSDVPIIMLTAKARETDLLTGFDAGADDYLTKPFHSKELLARIGAVLNRAQKRAIPSGGSVLNCGEITIDLARRSVTVRGEKVHLTRTEYSLLHQFTMNPNKVMLHEQLLAAVWGPEYRDDIDYLRAYIRFLRRKIEEDPQDPKLILTSPGVGYMLECPEEAAP